jgi:aryl-alcohol dehydrogenase-like predicted oxidoreductase
MNYRTLGRTGVEVSEYCLGTMMFGDWGNTDEDECIRMTHAALDAGINFVDTADVYSQGRSEEVTGKALKGKRDGVVLATKVHGQMGEGRNRQGASRLWITRGVEDSLRRLQTDHIDVYQLHRPVPHTDLEETLGALTDLQRQGKIRYAGCSTYPAWMVVESHWVAEHRGLIRFSTEQPPYSIFVRHNEVDLFPVTQKYGMGVLSWSPLAGGWLTGKYRHDQEVPSGSRAERYMQRFAGTPVARRFDMDLPQNQRKLELIEQLAKVAADAGLSMTHMAHAFALSHPAVSSIIIGPKTVAQLDDALAGADVRLDEAALDAIDGIVPPGTTVHDADRGWQPPWMEPSKRRI